MTYLVERYLTAAAVGRLPEAVHLVVDACDASGPAARVRYLHSIYLPSEETCFCVFQAVTPEAVRAVNVAASFGIDRITDALVMHEARPFEEF